MIAVALALVASVDAAQAAVKANNQFAIALFEKLPKGNAKGNKFISPLSAFQALSMAMDGAEGEPRAQRKGALFATKLPLEELDGANPALLSSFKARESRLSVANSLWADKDI